MSRPAFGQQMDRLLKRVYFLILRIISWFYRFLPSRPSSTNMNAAITPEPDCLLPLNRCKILHLVRHAQGIHNVAGEKDHSALLSYEHLDAQLSPLGWQQVGNLRKQIRASGLIQKIDLVITSPLLRAMQTAVGVFGSDEHLNGLNLPELMEDTKEINGLCEKCPPFMATDLCRERVGVHPCDKRRDISDRQPLFPTIDFSLIESNEDNAWKADVRETDEELAARGIKFMDWLWTFQEREIAIVTHNRFLEHTLKALANNCDQSLKNEICQLFGNCELRSFVMINKKVIRVEGTRDNKIL